jgi:hypothetical protein
LISHHPTFFSSDVSNISLEGMMFPSPEEWLAAIREIMAATRKRPYKTCLTTGWSDPNGYHRTMVTTIHKLNIG